MKPNIPIILAPAGDKNSFLAAIAAGADAVYCGLKIFSARMKADNFDIEELSRLTQLARSNNIKVYIAFNSIIKEREQEKAFNILNKLCLYTDIDALIVQDLALISIAKKAGYKGEFHLSTLGNMTFTKALPFAKQAGFKRVVLPREMNIDEIKAMASTAPKGIDLEVFVHGALCYAVSGRCYWSSWFGGKSSLRGRCVQPCRRMYTQKGIKDRFFSCTDFSIDVLAKILKGIPNVTTWKIEGRKKSPHYVYYTVKAYRLLRDEPKKKKEALALLDYAMGREFTHYNILSQRPQSPLDHSNETGSGLFSGRIKAEGKPYFITREDLIAGDILRIGYEDDASYGIQRVTRAVPKKGKFYLNKGPKMRLKKGTPVFIIDRREKYLGQALSKLELKLSEFKKTKIRPVKANVSFLKKRVFSPSRGRIRITDISVTRGALKKKKSHGDSGVWISNNGYTAKTSKRDWLWVDPVLFPEEEKTCQDFLTRAVKKGRRNFVLNSPWQITLFDNPKRLNIWAGPFCNVANSITISSLKRYGFSGAIVSPELDKETFLALPRSSELPIGAILYGNWPLAVSRIVSKEIKIGQIFTSPKGEGEWVSKSNNNYYIFPQWCLDLNSKREELKKAGYTLFASLHENIPCGVKIKTRPGLWNWNLNLL
jgi:U32 family peptidase